MTNAYLLMLRVDHEGDDVLGVFSTPDLAKAVYPDAEWSEAKASDGSLLWRCFSRPKGFHGDSLYIATYVLDDRSGLGIAADVPLVDLDSVCDPNFTGGLDPVEYLRRLHAGEL